MRRYLLVFLWIGLNSLQLLAQKTYPVKATLVLRAPHSPYVSDYISIDTNPLALTLLNQDASFSGEVVFRFSMKGVGITIQSSSTGTIPVSCPLATLVMLSGADLSSYFLSSNLSFSGYSKTQYDQKGILPEGLYEFSFQAFDAKRNDIAVSNVASFMCWIQLHDPPQLIFPKNQSTVESKIPQQVSFQWQGTTLTSVSYELELYELRVTDKRDPNEVIRGATPIFTTTTSATTYLYSVNDPPLQDGMNYAFRVRAKVDTEKELIKNQGYSSTFTFTYLPTCRVPSLVKSNPNKNKTALITWAGEGKEYLIQYREEGQADWYEELSLTESLTISQLRPGKKYEYRIKSICEYNYSDYTKTDTFSIPYATNIAPLTPPAGGYPEIILDKSTYLENASPGMIIKVNYFEVKIIKAIRNEMTKLWTGQGTMYIPSWRANVLVEFKDIHINTDQRLVAGHVHGVRAPKPITKVKLPAVKQVKNICLTYGPDGYDEEGYDKNGYDRDGYNKEGRDKDGYDNYGYNAQGVDRNGKPKQIDPTNTQGNPTTSTGTNGNNSTQTGTQGNNQGGSETSSTPQADGSDSTKTATVNPSVTQFAVDQNQIYGFDNSNSKAIWKSIEQGKEDKVIYNVKPSSVYPRIYFKSVDLSIFSVDPLKATGANQSLKLKSNGWADTTHLEVKLDSMKGKSIDKLNVVVYPKKVKNLKILILHEENDDVQVVTVGDKVSPNTVCVKKGINDFLDTKYNWVNGVYNQQGDDTLNIDGNIIVGKNGICETEALNKPLKTSTIDIAQLRDVLNNQIYNQAVLEWNVTEIKEITVNWDLNRNQKFEIYDYGLRSELIPGHEFLALKNHIIENNLFDNISGDYYYIILTDHSEPYISNNQFTDPYGLNMKFPNKDYAYVFGNKSPEKLRTIGHELGHSAFGFFDDTYLTKQPLNLMNHVNTSNYLKRIFLIKEQWDIIQKK